MQARNVCATLRPDVRAASHPEHIRVFRADERRGRADPQRHRRARRRVAKRGLGWASSPAMVPMRAHLTTDNRQLFQPEGRCQVIESGVQAQQFLV